MYNLSVNCFHTHVQLLNLNKFWWTTGQVNKTAGIRELTDPLATLQLCEYKNQLWKKFVASGLYRNLWQKLLAAVMLAASLEQI